MSGIVCIRGGRGPQRTASGIVGVSRSTERRLDTSDLDVPALAESTEVNASIRVSIDADTDIVAARQQGRRLAVALGFSSSDATVVATAISELARNIVLYARRGEIILGAA